MTLTGSPPPCNVGTKQHISFVVMRKTSNFSTVSLGYELCKPHTLQFSLPNGNISCWLCSLTYCKAGPELGTHIFPISSLLLKLYWPEAMNGSRYWNQMEQYLGPSSVPLGVLTSPTIHKMIILEDKINCCNRATKFRSLKNKGVDCSHIIVQSECSSLAGGSVLCSYPGTQAENISAIFSPWLPRQLWSSLFLSVERRQRVWLIHTIVSCALV